MVRVICIRHSTTAGFKLTKLFGIYDFSVEKDSGKVLIIIIYCFYNYSIQSRLKYIKTKEQSVAITYYNKKLLRSDSKIKLIHITFCSCTSCYYQRCSFTVEHGHVTVGRN